MELLGEPSRRERRLSPRIPTNLKARYYKLFERSGARQCLQGEILDISSGGAFLNTDELLQVGSELMLVFEISMYKEEDFTTGIGGRIVRKQQVPITRECGYGVEFNRSLALSG